MIVGSLPVNYIFIKKKFIIYVLERGCEYKVLVVAGVKQRFVSVVKYESRGTWL